MPGNDSRRHSAVHNFLKHHPMAVLSTVDDDGKPWGSAIYFSADEDFKFYFVTRVGTFKYQNLDKKPFAALTVADAESQTTVQAAGRISKVPLEDYADVIFNKLARMKPKDDFHWAPPISKVHKGGYIVLCLTPSKLQYADYGQKEPANTDYIKKIIPEKT